MRGTRKGKSGCMARSTQARHKGREARQGGSITAARYNILTSTRYDILTSAREMSAQIDGWTNRPEANARREGVML